MRNATVSQPVPVAPIGNWFRYGIAAVVIAIAAALAVQAFDNPTPAADMALTRAQQAWADRLTGLAEATGAAERAEASADVAVPGQIDAHESPEISRAPAPGIDPHESPEISRAPAAGVDPHVSPEVLRAE